LASTHNAKLLRVRDLSVHGDVDARESRLRLANRRRYSLEGKTDRRSFRSIREQTEAVAIGGRKPDRPLGLSSLVLSQQANHSPQRLNALTGNGCIYLSPDRLGGLITKLL
jgi:hypothetical protein